MTSLIATINPQPDVEEDFDDVIKKSSDSCPLYAVAKSKKILQASGVKA
jgi:hypothetical protein